MFIIITCNCIAKKIIMEKITGSSKQISRRLKDLEVFSQKAISLSKTGFSSNYISSMVAVRGAVRQEGLGLALDLRPQPPSKPSLPYQ